MPASTAYAVAQSQLGAAVEVTRGTAVAPTAWLPYLSPDYHPNLTQLEDKGMRGSMVDVYDLIPGMRYDELGFSGYPYLDTFPLLLRALLGSTDGVTVAPANTALSSAAAVGATTIQTTATVAAGSYIVIGSGGTVETHKTATVTGTGPFTLTLATPLVYAQPNAATVTGLTQHKIGLLNNAGAGNQPPSLTLTDYDGEEWRQITGAQMDSLSLKWAATQMIEYQAKFLGNPATTPSAPSASYTSEHAPAAWTSTVSLGGTQVGYLIDGEVNLARGTKPIPGLTGTQAPFMLFAGPLSTSGKLTVVEQSGATQLSTFTQAQSQGLDITWFDIYSGHALNLHFSTMRFKTGKLVRSKEWVEAELEFVGLPSAGDAVAGGVAPLTATVANTTATSY